MSSDYLPRFGVPEDRLDARGRVPAPGRATLTQRLQRREVAPVAMASMPALDAAALVQRHRIQEADLATAMGFADAPAAVVQRHGDAATGLDDHEVRAVAAHGVAGAGGTLPHLAAIQRSFGAHDVSGVRAHVGGAAAAASDALGAEAYATGASVAFRAAPSLFVAAHEAAHVVQQRGGVQFSGAVGQAGDAYEQHADAVAARVVAGESAEDLLGQGAHGGAGAAIQRKEKPDAQAEPPTQAQAASATIFAVRAHMKATSVRMYAVASNMRTLIAAPASTEAGVEPIVMGLQQQFDAIMGDLDGLRDEIARVPDLMAGALGPELGLVRGAWHDATGLAAALNAAYFFTHDKDGRLLPSHSNYTGSVSAVDHRIKQVFQAARVEEHDVAARTLDRAAQADLAGTLGAAVTEALDDGLHAITTCVGRLTADLDAPDSQKDEATELMAVLSVVESSHKAIDAKHVGPLGAAIHAVEALQAALATRTDPKSQLIARRIGHGSPVSVSLAALKQHLKQAAKARR